MIDQYDLIPDFHRQAHMVKRDISLTQGKWMRAKDVEKELKKVTNLIQEYGGIDGAHHKDWLLDQIIRLLTGDKYEEWVAETRSGDDGPHTYSYDEGIAP